MPKYKVTLEYHSKHEKTLSVHAKDEEQAEEKAFAIVDQWQNAIDPEILETNEEY